MATTGPPWMWMACALITALTLRVTEPVLANEFVSCNNLPTKGASGSTQDFGAEARGDTQMDNDSSSGSSSSSSSGSGSGSGSSSSSSSSGSSSGSNSSGNRIVNGTDCEPHAQPWQASLLLKPDQLYCGAVLVHPQWLLTAAHCWKKVVKIRLGHHSLSPMYEHGQQMFRGVKTIPHPGYSHPAHSNDLMLIKLNRRVQETLAVKPINISSCCPTAGTSCMVSGWGTTSSPQVNFPKVLQCLNITVLSREKCKESYPGQIDDTMFCAGDEVGRDSCQGDSGGPVVCNNTLQGIVSWGDFPCGKPNKPGVYTNLCKFTKWIQDTIKANP